METGFGMVQRSWLIEKPTSNIDWAEVLAQFYFAAIFSRNDGTIRLASGWSVLKIGDIPIPEDIALSLAIKNMENTGENVNNYLENN